MIRYLFLITFLTIGCVLTACSPSTREEKVNNIYSVLERFSTVVEIDGHEFIASKIHGGYYTYEHHPDCLLRDLQPYLKEREDHAAKKESPRDKKCGRKDQQGKCLDQTVVKTIVMPCSYRYMNVEDRYLSWAQLRRKREGESMCFRLMRGLEPHHFPSTPTDERSAFLTFISFGVL